MAYMNKDRSDMKLFKNRLLELMDRKGISSAKDLAKQLHRDGLVSVNHRQDDMNPFDKEKNAIGSIEKRIQSHLNANTPDKLQGEYARAYCAFFGCSYDYLFGVDEIPNKTVKTIHDETGLSEKAITRLMDWHRCDDRRQLWSSYTATIIGSPNYEKIMEHISMLMGNAKCYSIEMHLHGRISSDDLDMEKTSELWYLSKLFTDIMEDLHLEALEKSVKSDLNKKSVKSGRKTKKTTR